MRRLATLLLLVLPLTLSAQEKTPPEGILPRGKDGKALNLDFETGDLRDWSAEGQAFKGQPIKGDVVHPRRADSHSRHQGQFWIGGFERFGDKPKGKLTSVPFEVTHPWATFLVGGGSHSVTCVELVRRDTGKVFFRASGLEEEDLKPVAVDLRPHVGKEIFVRVVDGHTGHWGHVNFDDFRFHAAEPKVPARPKAFTPPPPDQLKFAGLPPKKAAAAMTVPEGFDVKLFAGEPDIHQPVAFCIDDRGRLWVVEAHVYPQRKKTPGFRLDAKQGPGDSVVIYEDTDGDGVFDTKKPFIDNLNLVSGIEVGFGGVYIGAAPYLLFIPRNDKDEAGTPQVLLDGFGWHDTHETLNTFTWGPDGWLYGCHGIFTHSKVGKPGAPDNERVPLNAGVWRYHPTKHVFEVFAQGTSNPWGLDFNEYGEAFVEACVIPHCFHIIQGARYHRQAGSHFNPHTYDDIKTIADHRHYVGGNPHGGNNRSDSMGGGHAHCGLMCYLGGTWPEKYHGQLFMGNIHGRRINVDLLKPKGSGYVAGHGPDFLLANDAWARFINLQYGPDGNVFLIDWYDKQACHTTNPTIWDKTNGRIYKVTFRASKWEAVDLAKKSDLELANLQLHPNDWHVRHARRLLQERHAAGKLDPKAREELAKIAFEHKDQTRRLRGLWALHVTGGLNEKQLRQAFADKGEYVRGWTIQLGLENPKAGLFPIAGFMTAMAQADPSPISRRFIASAMQRQPLAGRSADDRSVMLGRLLRHAEDNADHNLPLLYWYALEPMAAQNPQLALDLALKAEIPILLPYMVRRIGSSADLKDLSVVIGALQGAKSNERKEIILGALRASLQGRPKVAMPSNWPAAFALLSKSGNDSLQKHAQALSVTFGDLKTLAILRQTLVEGKVNLATQEAALTTLLALKDPGLDTVLFKLVDEGHLRSLALKGLANYNNPKTPIHLLNLFPVFSPTDKRNAVDTLAARPAYAHALLDAIGAKRITAGDVSADVIRQLRILGDKSLEKKIADVWGIVRVSPVEKKKQLAEYRKLILTPGNAPDLALGRAIFRKTCYQCHKLFGEGGTNGPEITGANRKDLDYLLENILDPSAVIPKEYATTIFELESGRFLTGILKSHTPAAYQISTATETLTIPRTEVASMKLTTQSLMPDDQLKPMTPHDVRSLFAYLQSPGQTPILATPDTVGELFNAKDLTGWTGDAKLWSVEKGEIVGKSLGIKHNSFLVSQMWVQDFRLTVKVKLTPDKENSGIQFRSEVLKAKSEETGRAGSVSARSVDVKGYQADIGAGWWGKLYEEHGRALLWKEPGDKFVKVDDWNEYKIEAIGSRIRTWVNGNLCVDLDDPKGARSGILALQIHSGGPMEVRIRDLRLEALTK